MIGTLFFKLLPVQVLIVAMGSINSIVDGVIAARYVDPKTVGVIGLFVGILGAINGTSSVILGGSSVLSGKYMGSGNIRRTVGIFSLNMFVTFMLGALITFVGLLMPRSVALFCGANDVFVEGLTVYIRGFSFGILPMMLVQQLSAFLQLERQSKRNYIGVAAMIVSNVTLDILLVAVFDMGALGLALSTAICNWIYLFILLPYYFTDKAQLKFRFGTIDFHELIDVIKIGFPGALLVFCLSLRSLVQNRMIILYAGQDGMAAKGAMDMAGGLFIAFCLGGGATIRMLASVFIGEEDRDSIRELIKIALTKLMVLTLIVTGLVIALAGVFASFFFADTASTVYQYTRSYFIIFGASIPLILLVQIQSNYLQAGEHNICVDVFSVIDGFFSVIIPTAILGPVMGAIGIWLATPIGIVICSLVYPIYAVIFNRHFPKSVDEWLLFKRDFGVAKEDRLILKVDCMEDVVNTSEKVHDFCISKGYSKKTSLYSALCLEEMARNIVEHGFGVDKKKHMIDVRAICKDKKMMLRIKDDCIAFDPVERAKQIQPVDQTRNIGLRMVTGIADEAVYQNLLGLNVMTLILH